MSLYHYNLGTCFEEIVARQGDKAALRYEDRTISFAELDEWSQRLAALLSQRGCLRGDVIAIGHNKRPLSYALMLAALRLGIAYVNLDVASPLARSLRILETATPRILFHEDPDHVQAMIELADAVGCQQLFLDVAMLPTIVEEEQQRQSVLEVDGTCIAYIMFTSGSTGVPKGVAVTHQNVLHFINWGKSRFGVSSQDNFANLSPMYFDNSVFDFYVGLFSGASLTPVYRELMTSPYELVAFINKMVCTIWFSVPSLLIYLVTMKALTADALPALRVIVFGGEGYPKVELKKLFNRFSKQADLVNVYGPTECTCICSAYTLVPDDFQNIEGLPTLGRLNPNFDYRILDENDQDAVSGELCLIGPNVAAGYFNDFERTEASFHTITDCNRFMKRMYRTGDLVREVDGRLNFIGRKDNQIKHMGYRIELEEIENALVRLPQVDQAIVVYQRHQAAYGKLVAYVACTSGGDDKMLLKALGDLVPDYMVPSRLIVMTELPKNANGKVDRQHLLTMLDQ
ncbi:MAG: amino acid adenylation domain-containing protein [Verrucomicrobiota bacterium]|nr:amino acid adenylation domain-containing protein [Verrucomicrobiota bacterium]